MLNTLPLSSPNTPRERNHHPYFTCVKMRLSMAKGAYSRSHSLIKVISSPGLSAFHLHTHPSYDFDMPLVIFTIQFLSLFLRDTFFCTKGGERYCGCLISLSNKFIGEKKNLYSMLDFAKPYQELQSIKQHLKNVGAPVFQD